MELKLNIFEIVKIAETVEVVIDLDVYYAEVEAYFVEEV